MKNLRGAGCGFLDEERREQREDIEVPTPGSPIELETVMNDLAASKGLA